MKTLYLRLAGGNLWKNRQSYFPFLLANIMLIFTVYSFTSIAFNPGILELPGAAAFSMVLLFGLVVIGFFSVLFLFYANGFLIKRRKKELGLYAILGMEKRHISRVIRHELSLCYLLSAGCGLGLGILLNQLLFMIISRLLQVHNSFTNRVSDISVAITLLLFAGIYILLILYNGFQVRAVSPIALLRGSQTGEREPSSRWPLAIIGLSAMIGGYVIAQRVQNPITAIAMFFIAVVLVVIGTYCLFTAGSLTILKLMKRNLNIYYKPKGFITISGMLYRMKQNAAGLASITILCTMAMVTVGTTVSMYSSTEGLLNTTYPSDIKVNLPDAKALQDAQEAAQTSALKLSTPLSNLRAFESYETALALVNGNIFPADDTVMMDLSSNPQFVSLSIFTEATFARIQGNYFSLADNQVAWYSFTNNLQAPEELSINNRLYSVRPIRELTFFPAFSSSFSLNAALLVVKDSQTATQLMLELGEKPEDTQHLLYTLQMNVQGDAEAQKAFAADFRNSLREGYSRLYIKAELRQEYHQLFGGFLFVGIFLGVLFMMATALIIYFKQLSEGYQDHDRFIILQKVGMSQSEVRSTVRTQILLVFFLPLVVAICHVAGSLHMMTLMLRMFSLTDTRLIALSAFLTAAGIAVLYSLFYLKTNKTYYRLVKMS